jgi:TPP-dependent pyruvate/acetoin dehydrogenase alpha subunit
MKERNLAADAEIEEIAAAIETKLDQAIEFAKKSPFPTENLLLTEV